MKQKLFDQNGEVDEDALLYEVHSDLRDFVLDNLAKKEKQVLDALRIETYTPEWKPQLDRIHLQNGTYFLDERGFVPEKELCLTLVDNASPIGVILAASSRSNTGLSPCSLGLPSGVPVSYTHLDVYKRQE